MRLACAVFVNVTGSHVTFILFSPRVSRTPRCMHIVTSGSFHTANSTTVYDGDVISGDIVVRLRVIEHEIAIKEVISISTDFVRVTLSRKIFHPASLSCAALFTYVYEWFT